MCFPLIVTCMQFWIKFWFKPPENERKSIQCPRKCVCVCGDLQPTCCALRPETSSHIIVSSDHKCWHFSHHQLTFLFLRFSLSSYFMTFFQNIQLSSLCIRTKTSEFITQTRSSALYASSTQSISNKRLIILKVW